MSLSAKVIPPISEAFFKELDAVFKFAPEHIDLTATLSEIQRKAGHRDVVEWCRKHIRAHQLQSTVDVIVKP